MNALADIKAAQQLLATQLAEFNRLCANKAWGEETLVWMFQPYELNAAGDVTGFFYTWPLGEGFNSADGAILWLDENRTLSDQLTIAITKLYELISDY